jgi:hypothetical protein
MYSSGFGSVADVFGAEWTLEIGEFHQGDQLFLPFETRRLGANGLAAIGVAGAPGPASSSAPDLPISPRIQVVLPQRISAVLLAPRSLCPRVFGLSEHQLTKRYAGAAITKIKVGRDFIATVLLDSVFDASEEHRSKTV